MYQDWMEKTPVLGNFENNFNEELENVQYVQCCPVCIGRGFVPSGFYNSTGLTWVSSTTGNETCRSCNGKGYIII